MRQLGIRPPTGRSIKPTNTSFPLTEHLSELHFGFQDDFVTDWNHDFLSGNAKSGLTNPRRSRSCSSGLGYFETKDN